MPENKASATAGRTFHTTWKKYTEWPLIGCSVAFLILYSIQVINNYSDTKTTALNIALQIIWVVFGIDYIVQLSTASNRKQWFFKNILQLVMLCLPMLRPLRVLRLLSLLRFMQMFTMKALQGQILLYVTVTATLFVYIGALAVLDAEQDTPTANITTFGNALWWAVETITTVGYGDYYPVTLPGRLVAVSLMISGITVLGLVTATLASWLLDKVKNSPEKPDENTTKEPQSAAESS